MTTRIDRTTSHRHTLREDVHMVHKELRLWEINQRHTLERSIRHADRTGLASARSIRSRIGESLIRLGRRVAGEHLGSPALTG